MPPGFYHLCPEDPPVKTLFIAAIVASSLAAGIARADGDCQAKATAKNLHGAAETSFIKKCEKDSAAASAADSCKAKAADKNLHGAAQTSFVNKCVKDNAK